LFAHEFLRFIVLFAVDEWRTGGERALGMISSPKTSKQKIGQDKLKTLKKGNLL